MDYEIRDVTLMSLYGIRPIINDIVEEVVQPIRLFRDGKPPCYSIVEKSSTTEQKGNLKVTESKDLPLPPKLIQISGSGKCGKFTLTSAIVNELRRGPHQKRTDMTYLEKKVKFVVVRRDLLLSWDINILRNILETSIAKRQLMGYFTVIIFQAAHVTFSASIHNLDEGYEDEEDEEEIIRQNFITAFCQILDAALPGKFLIVLSTSTPTKIDKKVLSKVDFSYELSYADSNVRQMLITEYLQAENVVLSSPAPHSTAVFMTSLVSSIPSNLSSERILYYLDVAITNAKRRMRGQSTNEVIYPVQLQPQDFASVLNLTSFDEIARSLHDNQPSQRPDYIPPSMIIWDDEDKFKDAPFYRQLLEARTQFGNDFLYNPEVRGEPLPHHPPAEEPQPHNEMAEDVLQEEEDVLLEEEEDMLLEEEDMLLEEEDVLLEEEEEDVLLEEEDVLLEEEEDMLLEEEEEEVEEEEEGELIDFE